MSEATDYEKYRNAVDLLNELIGDGYQSRNEILDDLENDLESGDMTDDDEEDDNDEGEDTYD